MNKKLVTALTVGSLVVSAFTMSASAKDIIIACNALSQEHMYKLLLLDS